VASRAGAVLRLFSAHLALLALAAAAVALAAPSAWLARRSDLLLAALVAVTALGIDPRRLAAIAKRWRLVVGLALVPFALLALVGWLLDRAIGGSTGAGVVALGLSSSEVASVGLVALAGGEAALALGVLTVSLVLAALAGPLLAGALVAGAAHPGAGALLARFALVVIVPLSCGLALRGVRPTLERAEPQLEGAAALIVSLLVYAALSGAYGLGGTVFGALAFLAASAVLAVLIARALPTIGAATVGLPVGMRDFAVAAALATAAFGPRAGGVTGVYGALMLVGGAATTAWMRRGRRAASEPSPPLAG
jgi:predicted Na+-dependent transporter